MADEVDKRKTIRLCLSNMIRANRKRRLLMHMALNNLLARRRQLLCVCYVMLMFTARRNVVARVPRVRSCRSRIRPVLQRQNVTEEPISPEERLGICLYRLGRGDYFYTIAEMVGRGISTVSAIVQEVSEVLVEHLWHEAISSNLPKCREGFEKKIVDMEELLMAVPLQLGSLRWLSYSDEMSSRRPCSM
ncbi:Hypothetical predicted protein [Paramuricea clavata]|uniref:Uncharacterized protein n=1 Tax=Paramuricea clavata TaxID=317549 RepID=A0A6S7G9U1_PARCT|nr:Hypothetical predicted protein [Paramuricea clavata]